MRRILGALLRTLVCLCATTSQHHLLRYTITMLRLILQATYSNARCEELQNHMLMAALVEMMKNENAIDGLSDDDDFAARVSCK